MTITLQALILEIASRDFPNRPWRFDGEPLSNLKALRTDGAFQGRTGVDVAPPLQDFSSFVGRLLHERLVNASRSEIEDKYNVGLWSDAWDGLFYRAALRVSLAIATDERITLLPEYAGTVRFFDGWRVFLESNRAFVRSQQGQTITMSLTGLTADLVDGPRDDLLAICPAPTADQVIAWVTGSSGPRQAVSDKGGGFDVFISHSSHDAAFAHEIYDFLKAAGRCVFLSEVSLQYLGSSAYMKAIDTALEQSRHMVLAGTSVENLTSGYVEAEWRIFINELRARRKQGNFITVIQPDLLLSALPVALRCYEVIPAAEGYLSRVLRYVA